jgi:hypothetical protein
MRPKPELAQVLAPILTKQEFLAAYAISWVSQAMEAYGWGELTDMERDACYGSLGAEIVFGIRALSRAGYRFSNFTVEDSGTPKLHDTHTLFPGNLTFVAVLGTEQRFNYLAAVEAAIELINAHSLQLDLDPLKQAKREIVETLAIWKQDMSPEQGKDILRDKHQRMMEAKKILERASGIQVD